MKYDIVQGKTLLELIEKVNVLVEKGWKPQGGVSTGDTYGSYVISPYYIQALIKD